MDPKHLNELRSLRDRLAAATRDHDDKNAWLNPDVSRVSRDMSGLVAQAEQSQHLTTPQQERKAGRADVTRLTHDVPTHQVEEVVAAWEEIVSGRKEPRTAQRADDRQEIATRASDGLNTLLTALQEHPGTGQARSIVNFLASMWDPSTYPLDTRELRGLDTKLGNAVMDYMNYDRLGIRSIDAHVSEKVMVPLLRRYGLLPEETARTASRDSAPRHTLR